MSHACIRSLTVAALKNAAIARHGTRSTAIHGATVGGDAGRCGKLAAMATLGGPPIISRSVGQECRDEALHANR
jgi:hypothetical protein